MKFYLLSLLTLTCFISCQEYTEKTLVFNPAKSKSYTMVTKFDRMEISQNVTCDFKKLKDTVQMNVTINDLQVTSDKYTNMDDYIQNVSGQSFLTSFDKYGNASAEEEQIRSRLTNPEFLVVQFPKHKIKVGDVWKARKSTKPDLIFDYMLVRYECTKISKEGCVIEVEMICENDGDLATVSKVYTGSYAVKNDGTVRNATMVIRGSQGFSGIAGTLKIQEIE